jgi:coenzyme Q-binding protein COQ10
VSLRRGGSQSAVISSQAIASSSTPLFQSLETTWRFQPASSQSPHVSTRDPPFEDQGSDDSSPTLVSYDVAFAFANPVHAAVSTAFFSQVSKLMIQAFEERCLQVHGKGRQ